jgi:hypothetical protein
MPSGLRKLLTKKTPFQLKVLDLYKDFVKVSRTTPGLLDRVRDEFREASTLNIKNDSLAIDYKIRRAKNQLEMLKTSNVKSIKSYKF